MRWLDRGLADGSLPRDGSPSLDGRDGGGASAARRLEDGKGLFPPRVSTLSHSLALQLRFKGLFSLAVLHYYVAKAVQRSIR